MRLPRPSKLIRRPLLVERSRAGERRRARVGAASGVAFLFLGLLWAAGLGRIVLGLVAGTLVVAGVLELAAALQALRLRRALAAGRAAAWTAAAALAAVLPWIQRLLAVAFTTTIATLWHLRRAVARGRRGIGSLAAAPALRAGEHRAARFRARASGFGGRVAAATAALARRTAAHGVASMAQAVGGARRRRRAIAAEREAFRLNALGVQLRRSGAADAAAERHRAALSIVRELGNREAEALTLNNVALALARNDAAAAVEHFEQAATILRELGDTQHEGQVIANLGIVHRRHGRSQEADRLLQTALAKLDPLTPEHRQVEEQLRRAS